MPLVYVHGIGNRWQDDGFQRHSDRRNAYFRQFLLPALGSKDPQHEPIPSPLWGDDAARLRWDGASLPGAVANELSSGGHDAELLAEVATAEALSDPDRLLCTIARRSVADAVDLLYTVADDAAPAEAAALVAYTTAVAARMPRGTELERHPWLAEVRDDYQFVDALWEAAGSWQLDAAGQPVNAPAATRDGVLGVVGGAREFLRRSHRRLRRAFVGLPTTGLAAAARSTVGRRAALLLGDVAAYLARRDASLDRPGGMLHQVLAGIEQARGAGPVGAPLVVVAHSMGGNIVYDLLTTYRTDLVVNVFVTVGSQVGLFEELELFRSSDPALGGPHRRVPSWPNIRHWINVLDPADPLAFRAAPVFDGVEDYRYPTDAAWAHSGYLVQPHFHARLAARVVQALR